MLSSTSVWYTFQTGSPRSIKPRPQTAVGLFHSNRPQLPATLHKRLRTTAASNESDIAYELQQTRSALNDALARLKSMEDAAQRTNPVAESTSKHAGGAVVEQMEHLVQQSQWQRLLLEELSASRAQVDRLLDQQSILISMVATAAGWSIDPSGDRILPAIAPSSAPSSLPPASQSPVSTSQSSVSARNGNLPQVTAFRGLSTKPQFSNGSISVASPANTAQSDQYANVSSPAAGAASSGVAAYIAEAFAAVESQDVLAELNNEGASSGAQASSQPAGGVVTSDYGREKQLSYQGSSSIHGDNPSSVAVDSFVQYEEPSVNDDSSVAVPNLDSWPILLETDGGREVHSLQVALLENGFFCGEDEMKWWMFGDQTANALRVYQACMGLPETGVCDERTWKTLLGEDAQPNYIYAIKSPDYDEYEDDLDNRDKSKGMYLVGEQRWSN